MQKRHALKLPFAGVFPIKMKQLQIVVHKIQTEAHCPLDFNAEKLLAIAKEAAGIGLDMLVLDDGWFGVRNDDIPSICPASACIRKLPL